MALKYDWCTHQLYETPNFYDAWFNETAALSWEAMSAAAERSGLSDSAIEWWKGLWEEQDKRWKLEDELKAKRAALKEKTKAVDKLDEEIDYLYEETADLERSLGIRSPIYSAGFFTD